MRACWEANWIQYSEAKDSDSTSKSFLDPGIRIPLHRATSGRNRACSSRVFLLFFFFCLFFFLSLRAGGILQILQSDWFRERTDFYDLVRWPGPNRWQLHSQVCLLFVNEQNRWFLTIFLLKLALLLALARAKWILLFRQNIWRENQASQPGKPLK